jgi:Fe-S-cluster-containing dehydrogenase component
VAEVLFVNIDSCVRCFSCEAACRQENNLSVETQSRWCQVMTVGPRWVSQELHMDFAPIMCFQCDDAICSQFCPVGAISRTEDGIVHVNCEACVGCELCVLACPFGCMYYNAVEGVAGKCELCAERVDKGLEPACVQHCIGGALQFLPEAEVERIISSMHAIQIGRVCYASCKWKLQDILGIQEST